MSQDETQINSDSEDQNEEAGDDLDTNDTDTGADDSQDTGDDTAGDDVGDEGDFKAKFKDQQKRADSAERLLKAAGLDPNTGKPKVKRTHTEPGGHCSFGRGYSSHHKVGGSSRNRSFLPRREPGFLLKL
jgi:hypothetical protein